MHYEACIMQIEQGLKFVYYHIHSIVGIKKRERNVCNYATKNYRKTTVHTTHKLHKTTDHTTLNYAIQIILQTNYLRTQQTQTK